MKKIKVKVKGISGYLMNQFPESRQQELEHGKTKMKKGIKTVVSKEEQAELSAYRMNGKASNLYIPASHFRGAILNASKGKKTGKVSVRNFVAGSIQILPDKIDLKTKAYEIFTTTAVNHNKGFGGVAWRKVEKTIIYGYVRFYMV